MPCQESIGVAKANFVSKVSAAISTLMDVGYSRERATNALMRELNRGESSTRLTDQEIFETMQRYDLGIEEATKAIVVSKAMRRAMIACESSAQAVDILTSKISLSNLLYDSSDEGVDGNMSSSSIRPELRVEPVVTTRKTRQAAVKMARPTGNSSSSSSNSRSNKPMTGRKRSIEETAPLEEKNEKRVRADSVTKEVEEKINAKKSTEEDASDNDSSSSSSLSPSSLRTPVVRGKRGIRVDDSETQTHVHKRIRGSEDC